jgi:hypothetical protein
MSDSNAANNLLMSGGIKAAKFETMGDIVRGRIVDDPKVAQMKKFESEELDFWPSGDPKMQIIVTIATDQRTDPEDDGHRHLYIVPRMMPAVREAVKAAGATGLAVGGTIAIQWTSGTGQGAGNAREYAAAYQPPVVAVGTPLLTATPTPAVPAAPAAVSTPPAPAVAAQAVTPPTTPAVGATMASLLTAPTQPTLMTAEPPPGMNIDPALWAALPEAQRAAVLASVTAS